MEHLSTSLSHGHANGNGTLCLFDDSPVRRQVTKMELKSFSDEVAPTTLFNNEAWVLTEELNRANAENKKLTQMLTVVSENYKDLKRQLTHYMCNIAPNNEVGNVIKRRKVENLTNNYKNDDNNNDDSNAQLVRKNAESSSRASSDEENSYGKPIEEATTPKITKIAVRTEASDLSLILKDGYQWRKYGQKVTRDNPCPRAYFRCSFAPGCPVKKKVQRSLEDQSILVAIYEGEHNHAPLVQQETTSGSPQVLAAAALVPCSSTSNLLSPTVALDLTKPTSNVANETTKISTNISDQMKRFSSEEFQKLLAEHMVSSLTKDPAFTSALAAAITGRFVQ